MDVEGAERELLDPSVVPSLRRAIILVEAHPFIVPGILNTLQARFAETHVLQLIRQGEVVPRNAFRPEVSDMHESFKMLLSSEGRPETMYWIYMVPNDLFFSFTKELDDRSDYKDFVYTTEIVINN